VVALAGGVGGAKFADGLAQCLPSGALTVIVNTGDDFRRYGLAISPDLDTVMYTLAGLANPVNGWGLDGDTTQMLGMLQRYGDDAWFGLGDKDVATHLLRTQWLAEGMTLTEVTCRLAQAVGIESAILPMSDDPAPTLVHTVEYGVVPFQEYFVKYRWQPTVKQVMFDSNAHPAAAAVAALERADLIVIAPSNPILSIEPILKSGFMELLAARQAVCIAISPIVDGQALKGPAAKLMTEMGLESSANGVARYYGHEKLIDGIVIQTGDRVDGVRALATDVVMHSVPDRARLVQEVLIWANNLSH
jgi:LPPG:FO 2-phospho-L-lactate transferase